MKNNNNIMTIDLKKAVSWIRDGMILGIGEFSYQNSPMTLVHEIIAQGKKDLTIVSGPTSGLATDMLISAGCVSRVVTACVAFESLCGIAPAFRQACQKGELEVWECDECIWQMALTAGAYGMPFVLWQGGIGSDIPLLNPAIKLVRIQGGNIVQEYRKEDLDYEKLAGQRGQFFFKIPPIKPDVSIFHAATADERGNVQVPRQRYLGRVFNEALMARATTGTVITSVEKMISNVEIMQNPELTVYHSSYIVIAPQGAQPSGCNGVYPPDLAGYRSYMHGFVK